MPQSQSAQDAVNHFRQQPWLAKIIDAPGITALIPSCRRTKSSITHGRPESQDELFRSTLNYEGGVPHILLVYTDPEVSAAAMAPHLGTSEAPQGDNATLSIKSASLILDLQDGVKGFNNFVHGGFLAAAMDEAMGALIFSNYEYQRVQEAKVAQAAKASGNSRPKHWTPPPGVLNMNTGVRILTASMNVRFRRPVSTPSTVVATATLNRIDGRKLYLDVVIRDEKGESCAMCEGMWISITALPLVSAVTKQKKSNL